MLVGSLGVFASLLLLTSIQGFHSLPTRGDPAIPSSQDVRTATEHYAPDTHHHSSHIFEVAEQLAHEAQLLSAHIVEAAEELAQEEDRRQEEALPATEPPVHVAPVKSGRLFKDAPGSKFGLAGTLHEMRKLERQLEAQMRHSVHMPPPETDRHLQLKVAHEQFEHPEQVLPSTVDSLRLDMTTAIVSPNATTTLVDSCATITPFAPILIVSVGSFLWLFSAVLVWKFVKVSHENEAVDEMMLMRTLPTKARLADNRRHRSAQAKFERRAERTRTTNRVVVAPPSIEVA